MQKFDERDQAIQYLSTAISTLFPDATAANATAQAMENSFMVYEMPDVPPGSFGLMLPRIRWVIRDDDLKLADCFLKAAASAASVNFFFVAAVSMTAIVGVLAAVFSLFNAARKKGARLTQEQCTLLVALRQFGSPVSVDQLANRLDVPTNEAQDRLLALTKLRCADGSVIAAVAQDGNGLWALAGV
jgi:hypothetical protein